MGQNEAGITGAENVGAAGKVSPGANSATAQLECLDIEGAETFTETSEASVASLPRRPSTEEPYIVSGAESISTISWCSAKGPESSVAHSNWGPIVAASLAKSWTNSEDRTERQRRSAQASYADVIGTVSTSIIPVGTGHNGCQENGTRVDGTGYLSFPPCTKGGSVVPMPSHVLELVLFSSTLLGEAQESTWDLECS